MLLYNDFSKTDDGLTGSFAIELSAYGKLNTTCLYMCIYIFLLLFMFINCVFVDNFDYHRNVDQRYLFSNSEYLCKSTSLLNSLNVTIILRPCFVAPVFLNSVNTSLMANAAAYNPDNGNTAIL